MLLVVAGCGGSPVVAPDAAISIDAAPDARPDANPDALEALDLACVGQPASPPATTAIRGKVFAVVNYEIQAEVGAAVELRRSSDDGLVAEATTGADGGFEFPVTAAVAGYFVVTATGRLVTRATSDTPLDGEQDALLLVADTAEVARWYGDAGTVHAAGARTAIVAVRDCARHTADGATLTAGAAPVTYYDHLAKRWDPALAASTNGFALIPAAPASLAVTPAIGSTVFPTKTLAPIADQLALAVLSPYGN
jgi:hypothetical protein